MNKILVDEKSGGIILILCTVFSLFVANSSLGDSYESFWHLHIGSLSISHWINDGLMAIFFLLIGLELERELYVGEFSNLKNAILPIFAAIGGMIVPAGIYLLFNVEPTTQSGFGIPMATDIAFALGALSLLGKKVPFSLKIFLTALAVIDDLGAIIIIAIFYTKDLILTNLFIAIGIFSILLLLNRMKVYSLLPYFVGGVAMWYFMLQSGVHATISGVLLAFAIPFKTVSGRPSPSSLLLRKLHLPVSFVILPIFALANTAVVFSSNIHELISQPLAVGVFWGLVLGKPLGILLASAIVTTLGLSKLPNNISWSSLLGISFLAGIGFTMSVFITLLAFDDSFLINTAKISILISSLVAGLMGFFYLKFSLK